MGLIKHSQITQSNKFAISLQYLRKEGRNGGHFWHVDKHQIFNMLVSFLMEVARHVQNTQNRKLVIFLQYIKTNFCNCFSFYCDARHSYFMGVQLCLLLLLFLLSIGIWLWSSVLHFTKPCTLRDGKCFSWFFE